MRVQSWLSMPALAVLLAVLAGCLTQGTRTQAAGAQDIAPPAVATHGPAPAGDKPWNHPGTKAGQEIVGPDGGKMVWVPAGEFDMGEEDIPQSHPVHHVRVTKGFWLAEHPVTNAQYRQYCQETGTTFPSRSDQGDDNPVAFVSWEEARAYSDHYGLSLPMEAQWEYAARGTEGRKYPWGSEWDKAKCCNKANRGPNGQTFPVGSFPTDKSWCGAMDMAGNITQWCSDWSAFHYYERSPVDDPTGPETGRSRIVRGGGWDSGADEARSASRYDGPPTYRSAAYGFRCAVTP